MESIIDLILVPISASISDVLLYSNGNHIKIKGQTEGQTSVKRFSFTYKFEWFFFYGKIIPQIQNCLHISVLTVLESVLQFSYTDCLFGKCIPIRYILTKQLFTQGKIAEFRAALTGR